MGIDHDYQFAFNCDTSTIIKIVSDLNLTKGEQLDNFSSGLWHDFPWWDSIKIASLKPYWKKDVNETYWYLWYDTINQKAYYFTFETKHELSFDHPQIEHNRIGKNCLTKPGQTPNSLPNLLSKCRKRSFGKTFKTNTAIAIEIYREYLNITTITWHRSCY
jgi:hypothetical protein